MHLHTDESSPRCSRAASKTEGYRKADRPRQTTFDFTSVISPQFSGVELEFLRYCTLFFWLEHPRVATFSTDMPLSRGLQIAAVFKKLPSHPLEKSHFSKRMFKIRFWSDQL